MSKKSLQPSYFDALYDESSDPWRFKSSQYEAEKYAATLGSLPRAQYQSGIEIGCSIGILTRMLAPRCLKLLGIDVAKNAIEQAKQNCANLPHVDLTVARFPEVIVDRQFDLIVLSEVLYYFDTQEMAIATNAVRKIAMPRADIVCVHWLGPTPDYPMTGDQSVGSFEQSLGPCKVVFRARHHNYRLDILRLDQAP